VGEAGGAGDSDDVELAEVGFEFLGEVWAEEFYVVVGEDEEIAAGGGEAACVAFGGGFGVVDADDFVGVVGEDAVVHFRDGVELGWAVAVDDYGEHFLGGGVVGILVLGLGGIIRGVVGNCQTCGFSPGSELPGL
jgi:hypothetical protein